MTHLVECLNARAELLAPDVEGDESVLHGYVAQCSYRALAIYMVVIPHGAATADFRVRLASPLACFTEYCQAVRHDVRRGGSRDE